MTPYQFCVLLGRELARELYDNVTVDYGFMRGSVNMASLVEACEQHIISNFTILNDTHLTNDYSLTTSQSLNWHIEHTIREAACNISVVGIALALLQRYRHVLAVLGDKDPHTTAEVAELFMAAYMAAARAEHEKQSYMTFWARVAGWAHTGGELAEMEAEFLGVVNWDIFEDEDWPSNGELSDVLCDYSIGGSDLSQGVWAMISVSVGESVERIPMVDEDDEALFLDALRNPSHWGPSERRQDKTSDFRRVSRMCNES